jgi:hypothetical protein
MISGFASLRVLNRSQLDFHGIDYFKVFIFCYYSGGGYDMGGGLKAFFK